MIKNTGVTSNQFATMQQRCLPTCVSRHIFLCILCFIWLRQFQVLTESALKCPIKPDNENRLLNVLTCDTRTGWKEFNALKVWNMTGLALRQQGLTMTNVCKGLNWGKYGFLTKPLTYLHSIQALMDGRSAEQIKKSHVILMDSDTYWAANSMNAIWSNYDCARANKPVLMATEMSCWIGRYCLEEDLKRYYSNTITTPSYSPFVNSGIVMGQINAITEMLQYVITNNKSYFLQAGRKFKFDDQYAYADYSLKVKPDSVALDFHEQISASCSIHAPGWLLMSLLL